MDTIATYAILIVLCLYQMVREASDAVFVFGFIFLAVIIPVWVRTCIEWGDKDNG